MSNNNLLLSLQMVDHLRMVDHLGHPTAAGMAYLPRRSRGIAPCGYEKW